MIMIKIFGIIIAGIASLWCLAWGFLGICMLVDTLQGTKKEAEEFRKWDR